MSENPPNSWITCQNKQRCCGQEDLLSLHLRVRCFDWEPVIRASSFSHPPEGTLELKVINDSRSVFECNWASISLSCTTAENRLSFGGESCLAHHVEHRMSCCPWGEMPRPDGRIRVTTQWGSRTDCSSFTGAKMNSQLSSWRLLNFSLHSVSVLC